MVIDRNKYKQYLREEGFTEEEASSEMARLFFAETISSVKIDEYIPYGEQYKKYWRLFNILTKNGLDSDLTYQTMDRYMHYCLQVNGTQRTAYKVVACVNSRFALEAEDPDRSGSILIEFHKVTPPPVGSTLELPDAMLQGKEDGPLFSNSRLTLGAPLETCTFPEDFKIEDDFAFLTVGEERIALQRYYG